MKKYYPIVKHSARFTLISATMILCYVLFSFCIALGLSHGNVIDAIRQMSVAWQRVGANVFLVSLLLLPVLVFTGFLRRVEWIIVSRLIGGRPVPEISAARAQPKLLTNSQADPAGIPTP